jgi:hypothetical protein
MGTHYTGSKDRITPGTSRKLLVPATETINPDDYYSSDIVEFYENLSEFTKHQNRTMPPVVMLSFY